MTDVAPDAPQEPAAPALSGAQAMIVQAQARLAEIDAELEALKLAKQRCDERSRALNEERVLTERIAKSAAPRTRKVSTEPKAEKSPKAKKAAANG